MNQQAFTIGNERSYDRALAEAEANGKKSYKLGPYQDPDEPKPYEGGWVWRSYADAQKFLRVSPPLFVSAVYELELPTCWEADVSTAPHPDDGVHRLLRNAVILRKVES